jgi:hypothetical protein
MARVKPESILIFLIRSEAKLPLALRASGLLFGMTPGILLSAATRPAPLFAPLLRHKQRK